MKYSFTVMMLLTSIALGFTQNLYFPPTTGNTWDTMSPSSLGWCQDKIDILYDYLEQNNSRSFILLKDGKIVLEQYFNGATQSTPWYWASAGKSLTAFLVGLAQQEGHLDINEPSSNYMGTGWTAAPANKEALITIKNQLTMTSGLDDAAGDPYCTIDTCLHYLADAGTRWAYHNGPYTLLDSVMEIATGTSLNNFMTTRVKNITGMTGTFVPSGFNNVYYSSARSMARFGLLILNRGNWNGTQIMTDTAYFNDMLNTSQNINRSYGYLWWLNGKSNVMVPGSQFQFPISLFQHAPADCVSALGKDGQFINVVPSQNLVFVRMGLEPGGSLVPFLLNDSIWQRINDLECSTTGTSKVPTTSFEVYPNPSHDLINLSVPPSEDYTLSLLQLNGMVISSQRNEASMSVQHLPKGMYLLELRTAKGLQYRKVLVD